ncbi:hypothetical protein Gpo141_00000294 [Globisporangium polare]
MQVKIEPMSADSILQEVSTPCPKSKKLELSSGGPITVMRERALQQLLAHQAPPKLESLAVDWTLCNPRALGKILSSAAADQNPVVSSLKELHTREWWDPDNLIWRDIWELSRQVRSYRVLERVSFTGD